MIIYKTIMDGSGVKTASDEPRGSFPSGKDNNILGLPAVPMVMRAHVHTRCAFDTRSILLFIAS